MWFINFLHDMQIVISKLLKNGLLSFVGYALLRSKRGGTVIAGKGIWSFYLSMLRT